MVQTDDQYHGVLEVFPYQQDLELASAPFPKCFPFSGMVPQVFKQLRLFVGNCASYAAKLNLRWGLGGSGLRRCGWGSGSWGLRRRGWGLSLGLRGQGRGLELWLMELGWGWGLDLGLRGRDSGSGAWDKGGGIGG